MRKVFLATAHTLRDGSSKLWLPCGLLTTDSYLLSTVTMESKQTNQKTTFAFLEAIWNRLGFSEDMWCMT